VEESAPGIEKSPECPRYSLGHAWDFELNVLESIGSMNGMSAAHKELVEKATTYLQELVPTATNITFEEFGTSLALENPPNAVFVVLSYTEPPATADVTSLSRLFSKRMKSVYMNGATGELLAIKNKLI
jgi:hypothetical protein